MIGKEKLESKKITSITDHLKELGEDESIYGRDPETGAVIYETRNKILAEKIWKHALKGDLKMMNIVLERLEGKPVNRTQTDIAANIGVTIYDDIQHLIKAKNQETTENKNSGLIKDD